MNYINNCHTLFLDSINYEQDLAIKVIEGKRASKPEPLVIDGASMGEAYRIESDSASKEFLIKFESTVIWQVVNESYALLDESEEFEIQGLFSVVSKSKYLDFVNQYHGWYKDVIGPGKLYRLWTENDIVEVVSVDEPTIVELQHT